MGEGKEGEEGKHRERRGYPETLNLTIDRSREEVATAMIQFPIIHTDD